MHISASLLVAFEFAHYLIFFMAIIFVMFTLVAHRGCLRTKREVTPHAICRRLRFLDPFLTELLVITVGHRGVRQRARGAGELQRKAGLGRGG